MKQISYFKNKKEFGGSLLVGRRKSARPISVKKPLHLILKSEERSVFSPGNASLNELIRSQAQKFNIRIYDLALNWTHIHLVIRVKEKDNYARFIRSLCSILAAKAKAKRPKMKTLFTLRPYTRILEWERDIKNVMKYIIINQMESLGLIKREKKSKSEKPPSSS